MMNERIKELIAQATTTEYGVDNGFDRVTFDKEKFAELIVRECMDVVDGYTKQRAFDTHYNAVEQIEALFGIKHFGVEE
jgi:hypothetical protein